MRINARIFGLAVVLLLLAPACRQSSVPPDAASDLLMSLTWMEDGQEPAVGRAELVVTLADDEGLPVNGATVALRGDMSHAGMQPVLATATAAGDGRYQTDFEWTMSGDWIVTVTATLPDGRTVTREFPMTVSNS